MCPCAVLNDSNFNPFLLEWRSEFPDMLPLSFIGVIQQLLGTLFEKCVMSIVAAVGFCTAVRIAFEKRW